MPIHAIGTDLIEVDRIESAIRRFGPAFLNRIFTPAEQAHCLAKGRPAQHFAARFAAKEAAAKALGTGIGQHAAFVDLEIHSNDQGAPLLRLHGPAARFAAEHGITRLHLSLSHTRAQACAQAVAWAGES